MIYITYKYFPLKIFLLNLFHNNKYKIIRNILYLNLNINDPKHNIYYCVVHYEHKKSLK